MVTNNYFGQFVLNECPSDIVITFGSNIPNLILIGVFFALENGEFGSHDLLWAELIDFFKQRFDLKGLDDDGNEL